MYFFYFMLYLFISQRVPTVPKWNIFILNCQPDHSSPSVGGANTGPVQLSTLDWSWFFGNMVAPFLEDLNELFQGLVNDILDWAGSVY